MSLKNYFKTATGTGVLATADKEGKVDAAVYSRPHIMDDGSLAFIMRERLTYENLKSNPHAAYLFMEQSAHLKGIRLFLNKTGEDADKELIKSMTRRNLTPEQDIAAGPKHVVYFSLEKILSLVGGNEIAIETVSEEDLL
jgi:hypothetical protein